MVLLHNLQLSSLYKNVLLEASVYENNGNTVLMALHPETHERIATLTVNLIDLPNYLVTIKNWSENEGVLEWLVENKIIALDSNYDVQSGFVTANGARLVNDELYQQAHEAYQQWKQENMTTVHLLDENDEPLLEADGKTPVTVDLEPDTVRQLERMAAERNIPVEELLLQVLDKASQEEQEETSEPTEIE